ncbi:MAG: ribosome-associated translation inhibitor RaiA [Veillonella sp.]|nr:ribosome-associated translation inhibitor RaiA [Veillonella sp.]
MKLAIRGKDLTVTEALRDYVEKRLDKISRYFDNEVDAQVLLATGKEKKTVEVTVFVDGIVLRGVEKHADMYAAIDLVVDKIVRQIHKHKTRLAKRFKKQNAAFHADALELEATIEEEKVELVKRKHFHARPMDVEEAILQMNLVGHDFFMFLNADTDTMNVVYRRHDGGYGLIEPEL